MSEIAANPEILKWARENTNMTLEEVASKLNKSKNDIESWEEGRSYPTYVQLETLAYNVYKKPIAFFLLPSVPEETNLRTYFRTLPDYEYNKISYNVIRLFGKAQAKQLNLKELHEESNPSNRCIFKSLSINHRKNINVVSKNVRVFFDISIIEQKKWRKNDIALKNWRSIFADSGIYVFKAAFKDDNISGFSIPDKEFPIIYINNSMPKTRQIFTLFHELAHLLFGIGGIDSVKDEYINDLSNYDRDVEVFCNRFAGKFLVPDDDFLSQISMININEGTVSRLANLYCVSREVILRKLLDKNKVSQNYYEDKVEKWIKEAKENRSSGNGGNYYYTKIAYLGENYLYLVLGQYRRNKISVYQTSDYLDIKAKNIPSLESYYHG